MRLEITWELTRKTKVGAYLSFCPSAVCAESLCDADIHSSTTISRSAVASAIQTNQLRATSCRVESSISYAHRPASHRLIRVSTNSSSAIVLARRTPAFLGSEDSAVISSISSCSIALDILRRMRDHASAPSATFRWNKLKSSNIVASARSVSRDAPKRGTSRAETRAARFAASCRLIASCLNPSHNATRAAAQVPTAVRTSQKSFLEPRIVTTL